MTTLATLLQIIIALGIVNVWLLRFGGATEWRGGSAQNMTEEFSVYGLPGWFMRVIGVLKISLAALLIVGVWVPEITRYAALGGMFLMLNFWFAKGASFMTASNYDAVWFMIFMVLACTPAGQIWGLDRRLSYRIGLLR